MTKFVPPPKEKKKKDKDEENEDEDVCLAFLICRIKQVPIRASSSSVIHSVVLNFRVFAAFMVLVAFSF